MPSNLYLFVMVGIMLFLTAVTVPSLVLKRCPRCGRRNGLDARTCRNCHMPFGSDDTP